MTRLRQAAALPPILQRHADRAAAAAPSMMSSAAMPAAASAASSSATSMPGKGAIVLPDPDVGLRIMLWNIQDLGGGPSRSPMRAKQHIWRIAKIIQECDPDVLVILEAKAKSQPPRAPALADKLRRSSRSAGLAAGAAVDTSAESKALKARYEEKMASYVKLKAKWDDEQKKAALTGRTPGTLELDRIEAALRGLGVGHYARVDSPVTGGEFYSFFCRRDLFSNAEVALAGDSGWPDPYRRPAQLVLTLADQIPTHAVPKAICILALHAPSPAHGRATHERVKAICNDLERQHTYVVLAMDSNVDTASRKAGLNDEAEETLLGAALADQSSSSRLAFHAHCEDDKDRYTDKGRCLFEAEFIGVWNNCDLAIDGLELANMLARGCTPEAIDILATPTGLFSFTGSMGGAPIEAVFTEVEPINAGALAHFAGAGLLQEYSVSSRSWTGRSSLRKSVKAAEKAGIAIKRGGLYDSSCQFHCAAYDKLFLMLQEHETSLPKEVAMVYPLIERVLGQAQLGTLFKYGELVHAVRDGIAAEYVDSWRAPGSMEAALIEANLLSDHAPLIMDLIWRDRSNPLPLQDDDDDDDDEEDAPITSAAAPAGQGIVNYPDLPDDGCESDSTYIDGQSDGSDDDGHDKRMDDADDATPKARKKHRADPNDD